MVENVALKEKKWKDVFAQTLKTKNLGKITILHHFQVKSVFAFYTEIQDGE